MPLTPAPFRPPTRPTIQVQPETTTHIEFLVDCVNAQGKLTRSTIPSTQASTPAMAENAVRSFCRHKDEFPLQSVRCVGVRSTVLTYFPEA